MLACRIDVAHARGLRAELPSLARVGFARDCDWTLFARRIDVGGVGERCFLRAAVDGSGRSRQDRPAVASYGKLWAEIDV